MRYILDVHALCWRAEGDEAIGSGWEPRAFALHHVIGRALWVQLEELGGVGDEVLVVEVHDGRERECFLVFVHFDDILDGWLVRLDVVALAGVYVSHL